MLPKLAVTRSFQSCTAQLWLHIFTFITLFEPFLLLFVLEEVSIPSRCPLEELIRHSLFKVHKACFFTYRIFTRFVVFSVSIGLSTPCATLWYFLLVIYLSNDISKNPVLKMEILLVGIRRIFPSVTGTLIL